MEIELLVGNKATTVEINSASDLKNAIISGVKQSLTKSGTDPIPTHYINTIIKLSNTARQKLAMMDKEFVGTDDYMGFANFWNCDYKLDLSGASNLQRVEVHHAFRTAGLSLIGNSDAHDAIVKRVTDIPF